MQNEFGVFDLSRMVKALLMQLMLCSSHKSLYLPHFQMVCSGADCVRKLNFFN